MKKRRIAAMACIALSLTMLGACGSRRADAPATEETRMQQTPAQTAPADTTLPAVQDMASSEGE
ncbi:MAG: hypothetical protein K8R90_03035 [Candidatus Cloacimonetes bacterium]|nr:hypothetical protein [Candidatus Cloacimonadota bacterium]